MEKTEIRWKSGGEIQSENLRISRILVAGGEGWNPLNSAEIRGEIQSENLKNSRILGIGEIHWNRNNSSLKFQISCWTRHDSAYQRLP